MLLQKCQGKFGGDGVEYGLVETQDHEFFIIDLPWDSASIQDNLDEILYDVKKLENKVEKSINKSDFVDYTTKYYLYVPDLSSYDDEAKLYRIVVKFLENGVPESYDLKLIPILDVDCLFEEKIVDPYVEFSEFYSEDKFTVNDSAICLGVDGSVVRKYF